MNRRLALWATIAASVAPAGCTRACDLISCNGYFAVITTPPVPPGVRIHAYGRNVDSEVECGLPADRWSEDPCADGTIAFESVAAGVLHPEFADRFVLVVEFLRGDVLLDTAVVGLKRHDGAGFDECHPDCYSITGKVELSAAVLADANGSG